MSDAERVPPYDLDAEMGVLGSMLLDNDAIEIAKRKLSIRSFYHDHHKILFEAICDIHEDKDTVDPVLLRDYLKGRPAQSKEHANMLEELGHGDTHTAVAYILDIEEAVPTVANIEYYCQIVADKALRRHIIEASAQFTAQAYNEAKDSDELASEAIEAFSLMQTHFAATGKVMPVGSAKAPVLRPNDLMAYDPKEDPDVLLGRRWICKGGSCMIVGGTGLGKSSLSMQAGVTWALGNSFFGIQPVSPLRSLFIQAENDRGDLMEIFQGVICGTGKQEWISEIQDRMAILSETSMTGDVFVRWLETQIKIYRPDICWLDPLYAFLGGNVSDQECVSHFLRNGLGAVAQKTGVAFFILHHVNKPPKDAVDPINNGDFSYFGAGSAELANWPRAVMVIREVSDDTYELRAAKRGRRAGLMDKSGSLSNVIHLKHGTTGICWDLAYAPSGGFTDQEHALAETILAGLDRTRRYRAADLRKIVSETLCVKVSATYDGRAGRVFNRVKTMLEED